MKAFKMMTLPQVPVRKFSYRNIDPFETNDKISLQELAKKYPNGNLVLEDADVFIQFEDVETDDQLQIRQENYFKELTDYAKWFEENAAEIYNFQKKQTTDKINSIKKSIIKNKEIAKRALKEMDSGRKEIDALNRSVLPIDISSSNT